MTSMIFEVTPGPGEQSSGRKPRILRRSACSALCAGIDHPKDGAGEYHYEAVKLGENIQCLNS